MEQNSCADIEARVTQQQDAPTAQIPNTSEMNFRLLHHYDLKVGADPEPRSLGHRVSNLGGGVASDRVRGQAILCHQKLVEFSQLAPPRFVVGW